MRDLIFAAVSKSSLADASSILLCKQLQQVPLALFEKYLQLRDHLAVAFFIYLAGARGKALVNMVVQTRALEHLAAAAQREELA